MEKDTNAIGIVKQMVTDGQVSQEVAERYFPELKESEDERIRKELIAEVKEQIDCIPALDCRDKEDEKSLKQLNKWLTWLEKQGKHANFRNKIQIGDKVARNENGVLVNLSQLKRVTKPANEEQKDILEDAILDSNEDGLIAETIRCKKEKQGDQKPQGKSALEAVKEEKVDNQNCVKPADKVETKFKDGDWVVYNNDICQIVKREEGCNKLITVFGIEKELVNERNLSTARFWTIQDAKDGDVLSYKDEIFIVKSSSNLNIVYYCCYDNYHFITESIYSLTIDDLIDIKPATKEERYLLFQKMKEAGYEWDAEHKQLKKIEQKSDDWKPQTGDTFRKKGTTSPTYHLCDKREDGITFGFVENREVGISGGEITIFALKNDYELVERPKSVEDVVKEELNRALQTKIEQKSWSEEDDIRLNATVSFLERYKGIDYENTGVCISWLKFLKDRYTWKPSDEQMDALHYVTNFDYGGHKATLVSLYEQLKKLREE